jgi:hypothetical protein
MEVFIMETSRQTSERGAYRCRVQRAWMRAREAADAHRALSRPPRHEKKYRD